jgi:predicted DNA-binding protein YlxM (UPF0122 family)
MFFKNMRVAYLLDFYGDLLDEHTAGIMRAYYNDDLSLAEVAGDVGISRQGIRHLIKKGEEMLEFYDSKLGLAARYEEISSAGERLSEIAALLSRDEEHADEAREIQEIALTIAKGN